MLVGLCVIYISLNIQSFCIISLENNKNSMKLCGRNNISGELQKYLGIVIVFFFCFLLTFFHLTVFGKYDKFPNTSHIFNVTYRFPNDLYYYFQFVLRSQSSQLLVHSI